MNKCLKCEKDYEAKRNTSKFCSTSCRVIWNRNNKNKSIIKEMQSALIQAMVINKETLAIFEKMQSIKDLPALEKKVEVDNTISFTPTESPFEIKANPYQEYIEEFKGCKTKHEMSIVLNVVKKDFSLSRDNKESLERFALKLSEDFFDD